jgi:ribosomal protein S18 acetylase RimI-like enzyme
MTADRDAGPRFREAGPGDAAALLALKQDLDRETSFMLIEPGERTDTAADVAAELAHLAGAPNSVLIVAEMAGAEMAGAEMPGAETARGLVGYVEGAGGRFRRSRRTVHIVIGVRAAASGQGVGSGLLSELESWARARGLHRLELTVMAHNRRASGLYERMGFAVEGRRRECLLVDGTLVDELYMAKLLY